MPRPAEPGAFDGESISSVVINEAFEWLVKFWSGLATPEDHQECSHWRAAHPDHERAWQRLQALEQRLEIIPRELGRDALRQAPRSPGRRKIVKALGALTIGGATAYAARQTETWKRYAADYRTKVGESHKIDLADSSRVTLNTASAIDVRFDTERRLVHLRTGEILVATAPDRMPVSRPFIVATADGEIRALGTHFSVRKTDDDVSRVAVFEGAVVIQPRKSTGRTIRLAAGEQAVFSQTGEYQTAAADENAMAWANGSYVVERMRLDDFLQELSRYRPGIVRCDSSAADYRLTGVYSLADTDRILASVERALPVKVIYRSRYWVTVTQRSPEDLHRD
jgi:transmembrane sensor